MTRQPNIRINQVNTLVLSKSLVNALELLPDRVYPFFAYHCDDSIDIMILPECYFTGCWFTADINPKTPSSYRFKAGRGEALANIFAIRGFKKLTNYKVSKIVPKTSFSITKEEI